MTGSPPRMRGRRHRSEQQQSAVRLTPAYAGKTARSAASRPPRWAHPRVCGEDLRGYGGVSVPLGSPPRMRGRRARGVVYCCLGGLTPAYAGKTGRSSRASWTARAHPRVCGEDVGDLLVAGVVAGSPPRMRGRRDQPGGKGRRAGLTPAYAGKTVVAFTPGPAPAAHPRVCGEDSKRS